MLLWFLLFRHLLFSLSLQLVSCILYFQSKTISNDLFSNVVTSLLVYVRLVHLYALLSFMRLFHLMSENSGSVNSKHIFKVGLDFCICMDTDKV